MTVYFRPPDQVTKAIKSIKFSGGELHVTSDFKPFPEGQVQVGARLQSSDDIMELVMATELLRRRARFGTQFDLVIPYFPYARQDRVTDGHTSFSLKAFASIINSLKYDQVTIYDPHSDVTPALVNNVSIMEQDTIIRAHLGLFDWIKQNKPVIIAPDAGAGKKAFKVSQAFGLPLLTAEKHRDTKTGALSGVTLNVDKPNSHALIVDDICDGGGTFVPLGKILKDAGMTVALYVTHGIFSKGFDVFKGSIDRIYTTDTFLSSQHPIGEDQPPLFIGKVCPAYVRGENNAY